MIYLDSCALIALTIERDPVEDLIEFLKDHSGTPMATSSIGFVETVRGASHYGQYPTLMAELSTMYGELTMTQEVRDIASTLPRSLRTLDALHVATALSIEDYLTSLVSYDRRLLKAAREQGLPVASPGMDD
ncbi:type II toxin-antitoxin system VapC family toxin [Glycomyces buryatensis]|uniref:Ribonuclease VapC n=1 Tax=Glycomyces buryatensis TaxID=2570927 RepID=A0A4S8QE86_9ACTN|nr:type II toxin-antitoxin system VapC family toxin [Glycomyces buryatensis]THV42903.1 type II toxin-antitoxin system VapC family toxin [Glycomyces buryatensis]